MPTSLSNRREAMTKPRPGLALRQRRQVRARRRRSFFPPTSCASTHHERLVTPKSASRATSPAMLLSAMSRDITRGTGGIRTPGPCGPPAFKAGAFVRSATVPSIEATDRAAGGPEQALARSCPRVLVEDCSPDEITTAGRVASVRPNARRAPRRGRRAGGSRSPDWPGRSPRRRPPESRSRS